MIGAVTDSKTASGRPPAEASKPDKDRLPAAGRQFRFRPVFTPIGGIFLAVVLFILLRSLIARNAYEITLASAALLLTLLLGIIGAWKARKLETLEAGWKPPFPMTAGAGEQTLITGLDVPIPLFFRLHFIVRGRFSPAGSQGACPVFTETSVPRGETSVQFDFDFPISGIFQGEGFCRLRDIFGFYSFSCGVIQQRTLRVRSSPSCGKNFHINAQSGAEDRRNKNSTNEERYYMREYTPGDRFRDINWKSSEKIDTLITRISPDNQEKVSRIEVYLRNYGPSQKTSLEALWLLDRAKARLSQFLRSLKEEQSSYIFNIRTAAGSWEIEEQEDLDAFLEELAGVSFSPVQNETVSPQGSGELYVFSTACDFGLQGFLAACNPRPVSLFLIQPAEKINLKPDAEPAILRKRDFPANGCIPLPRWLVRGKVKPLGAYTGKVEYNYAETRL
jgi:hypothetical protein